MTPQTLAAVQAFLLAHAPSGVGTTATGKQNGPGGLIAQNVYFDLKTLPPGIHDAALAIALVPRSDRTTLIAAYAHVTWFPARTTAEHLTAADFRSVTVSALVLNPRLHRVARTFTSAAVIASLASFLNGFQAAPDAATSCPGDAPSYQLRFSPIEGRTPEVIASTAGCGFVPVATGAVPQSVLWDPSNSLAVTAGQVLNISAAAG